MVDFSINKEIRKIFPNISVGLLSGEVANTAHNTDLWILIDKLTLELKRKHSFETIRDIIPIADGKKAYRSLGKDPNRYRISAEALLRRISKGQSIYQIHTLVDTLNLVSIKTGITIGGFDNDLVAGPIELGRGMEDEDFEAIGRGSLNIHKLPVYRDQKGAIGSPTSDCTRTMMRLETVNFLMIITGFYGNSYLQGCIDNLKEYLTEFASGKNFNELIEC